MMTEIVQKKRLLEDSFDITPSGLQFCFDRELFLRDEFNVDKFVMRQKKVVSLELLRDDLLQYFNILKNSLVELINQDYADFVNLSTNLVGLDKIIGYIDSPVEKLGADIEGVEKNIEGVLMEISKRQQDLKTLNSKREIIHSIESVQRCILRLEKWLAIDKKQENYRDVDDKEVLDLSDIESSVSEDIGQKLERVGNEFSKLEYFTRKCLQHPLMESFKPRIIVITSELQSQLETNFIDSLKDKNKKAIQQTLRTYLSINKVHVAEKLYQEKFIRPQLQKIIASGTSADSNCAEFFQGLLLFIDSVLNELSSLISVEKKGYDISSEFDFLVHSVVPEIIGSLMAFNPQFYSPGTPGIFHQRYSLSVKFLKDLEDRCTCVEQWHRLKNCVQYNDFLNKWSVPIYFQIRYQEIASNVEQETKIERLFNPVKSHSKWHIQLTQVVHDSLCRCWQQEVYLPTLRHRLWKLNVQLLNYLLKFLHSLDWKSLHILNPQPAAEQQQQQQPANIVSMKMWLLVDIYRLLDIERSDVTTDGGLVWLYRQHVVPALARDDVTLAPEASVTMENVLHDLTTSYVRYVHELCASIRLALVEQSCLSLKSVFDIPRQYRRTNKPWPTKASAYLPLVFKPLLRFIDDHKLLLNSDLFRSIVHATILDITSSYRDQIRELLASVKKMEDSWKRIKLTRGAMEDSSANTLTSSASQTQLGGAATGLDDDKIRKQVLIDCEDFRDKCLEIVGDSGLSVESLDGLVVTISQLCDGSGNLS